MKLVKVKYKFYKFSQEKKRTIQEQIKALKG